MGCGLGAMVLDTFALTKVSRLKGRNPCIAIQLKKQGQKSTQAYLDYTLCSPKGAQCKKRISPAFAGMTKTYRLALAMSDTQSTSRIQWIDSLRGVAIILMVIFHFCYDLRYFGWVDWNVPNGPNWWPFRYVILTLFIFTMGMSLSLAHSSGVNWKKFGVRLGQMVLAASAITIMSLFMFPGAWIYFGILHFLAFASIVGVFFVRVSIAAFGTGLLVLILYWSGSVGKVWPFDLPSGDLIPGLPAHTEDYVPVFPWLGVALLGASAGSLLPIAKMQGLFNWLPVSFSLLGRHGLIIYLVHQPLLFAGFFLVSKAV